MTEKKTENTLEEKTPKKTDKRYLPRFSGLPSTAVGRAVYRYREKRGITMSQFAEQCGMGSADVYRVESGFVTYPRAETLSKIAAGIGISHDAFIQLLMEDGYGREKTEQGTK